MSASPSLEIQVGTIIRGHMILLIPQEVPVAKAISKEMMNDIVGKALAGIPEPTIQLKRSRFAPTATMRDPAAQAKVKTIKAGKMRPIPYKKASMAS